MYSIDTKFSVQRGHFQRHVAAGASKCLAYPEGGFLDVQHKQSDIIRSYPKSWCDGRMSAMSVSVSNDIDAISQSLPRAGYLNQTRMDGDLNLHELKMRHNQWGAYFPRLFSLIKNAAAKARAMGTAWNPNTCMVAI